VYSIKSNLRKGKEIATILKLGVLAYAYDTRACEIVPKKHAAEWIKRVNKVGEKEDKNVLV
jgi:hypothetical protein